MGRFLYTALETIMAAWLAVTVISSPAPAGGVVYTVLLVVLLLGFAGVGYVAGHLIYSRHNRRQALLVAIPASVVLLIAEWVLYPYIPWLQSWAALAPSLLLFGNVVAQTNEKTT